MRLIAILAVALLLTGCTRPSRQFDIVGVHLKIYVPPFAAMQQGYSCRGEVANGWVTWDWGGVRFAFDNSRLSVHGRPYGKVAKGDRVTIDGDAVWVNDEPRAPEAEAKESARPPS